VCVCVCVCGCGCVCVCVCVSQQLNSLKVAVAKSSDVGED
jgi:hypothetical protein